MTSQVIYEPNFLKKDYFDDLFKEIEWHEQEIKIYNKVFIPKRKTTIYGNENKTYYYSGVERSILNMNMSPILLELRNILKDKYSIEFDCVLCNYYSDGEAYIGYHSDDEKDIDQTKPIISLTFGGSRDFCLKDKVTKHVRKYKLENRSLLYMGPGTQEKYQHSLPKRKNALPRINLTFRKLR